MFSTSPGGSAYAITVGYGYIYSTFALNPMGIAGMAINTQLSGGAFTTVATLSTAPVSLVLVDASTMYTGDAAGTIVRLTGGALSFSVDDTTANLTFVALGITTPVGRVLGLTAYVPPSGSSLRLLFSTLTTTSGGNWIVSFDTVTKVVTPIAQTCPGAAWMGLARAPVPLPSQTASATAAATATPSLSPSEGASPSTSATASVTLSPTPSTTPSGTPSTSATPSRTPVATGTPAACWSSAANTAPASASLIAFRIGGGTVPVGTVGTQVVFIDEVDSGTGATLQTWTMPSNSSGCVAGLGQGGHTYALSRSLDGAAVFWACLSSGTATIAPNATLPKAIWRLGADGRAALAATWTTGGTGSLRAVAATNATGTVYWTGGSGLYLAHVGSTSSAAEVRMFNPGAGGSFLAVALAPDGSAVYVTSPNTTTAPANIFGWSPVPVTVSTAVQGTTAPGAGTGVVPTIDVSASAGVPSIVSGVSLIALVFQSMTVAWAGDASGALYQFVIAGGAWGVAPGFPLRNQTFAFNGAALPVNRVQGLAGFTAASGAYMLAFTTGATISAGLASAGNYIVTFNTATGAFVGLSQACGSTEWRGLALAPYVVPPSQSATSTPTSTAPATPSSTSSASPTAPSTSSATRSVTVTASASSSSTPAATETSSASSTSTGSPTRSTTTTGTGTPTAAATSSASASITASGTAAPTQSLTSSASITASGTAAPTQSLTSSASITASGTAAPTQSLTGSATASPPSTLSPTGSALPTPSTSAVAATATGTSQPSVSRSKTAAATKSKTATRSATKVR